MTNLKRISKQASVKMILSLLEKGYASEEIVSEICSKFQVSGRTVYSHIKFAREQYRERQNKREKELLKGSITKEQEELNKALYNKSDKAKKLLSDIETMREEIKELRKVKIAGTKIGDNIIATTQQDVTNAKRVISSLQDSINKSLDLLAKWYGYNDPGKIDITSKGEQVSGPTVIRFVDISKENEE